jgi:polysaccharide chain length determinant protein (PEP-CTERM system associated)
MFAVPFIAAASFIMFIPNMYQSTATVLVERQQVPEALVRPTVTSELETRLRTISQEALSRSRLDALITRFGLYADLRKSSPQEAVIERMRSDIRLDLRGTDPRGRSTTIAFALSYRGRDPETVAQVTNSLASFFIEENLKARERQATGTAQFLKVQLQETRKRLDEQEKQVSDFKKRHVGELPQQMQANLATLEQLNAQLRLNSVNRMRLEEKRELLAMQVPEASLVGTGAAASPPPTLTPHDQASSLRLAQLKQQLDELASRFTPNHPSVVMKQAEITALEERLAREPKASPPSSAEGKSADVRPAPVLTPQAARIRQALGEVEAEIKVLKDEDTRLRTALATYEARVGNIPKREQEFQELSRDYDSTRELYQSLTKRYDEAQIAESMEQRQKGEQFRILDPALASALPAAPNRPRLIMVALVLALGLGVGAVVLAEGLDTSFHSLDRLRAFTSVPIIVSIPRIVIETDKRRRRWRFRLAAAGTTLALGLIVAVVWHFAHGNEALVRW